MSTHDFPALSAAARSSLVGRTCFRFTDAIKAAAATSHAATLASAGRRRLAMLNDGDRFRYLGISLVVAAITHYALSELQAAHQQPVAAAGVSLTVLVVGLALSIAGNAVATARPESRARAWWRRFVTSGSR